LLLTAYTAAEKLEDQVCGIEAPCQEDQVELVEEQFALDAEVQLLQANAVHLVPGEFRGSAAKELAPEAHPKPRAALNAQEGYRARRARLAGRAERRADPDSAKDEGFAWDQVSKAVKIDEIQARMASEVGQAREQLQGELDSLQQECPDAAQIKAGLAYAWDQIKKAVDIDDLKEQVEKAKQEGRSDYQGLKEQYEQLSRDVNVDQVKSQFYDQWDKFVQSLPSQDDLRKNWGDAFDKARTAASNAWDKISSIFR